MRDIISILPKWFLAVVALGGGILFIVLSDPPRTVCQAQMEVFQKAQAQFLYKDPKSKHITSTKFERLFEHCKETNNPGGCLELFQLTRTMLQDLDSLPSDCRAEGASSAEVKKAILYVNELLVRLAWGDRPPISYPMKFGWLETADMSLYCQLKQRHTDFFGESAWSQFRERLMLGLPGAKEMTRTQVWDLSLLSENCARYP